MNVLFIYTQNKIKIHDYFFRKDVRLPTNMQRAMATEAEATR